MNPQRIFLNKNDKDRVQRNVTALVDLHSSSDLEREQYFFLRVKVSQLFYKKT